MDRKDEKPTGRVGLLANGSSGPWSIAVDESVDRDEWSIEIDGPQVYLVFQLAELTTPLKALQFLQLELTAERAREPRRRQVGEDALTLGHFGPASVSLVRDNEDFARCFLVIGPRARSTFRLSLDEEDIRRFTDALRQVVADIPEGFGE